MDHGLLKYIIQMVIYICSFFVSAFAVKAIPFHKFLDHNKVQEAWVLYILTTLALTFCIGTLISQFIGLNIWLPN